MAEKNLTGEQIQQVLDVFLYKALEPIVLYSNVFDHQVSYILSIVSSNRKRKVSSLDREVIIDLLCSYLFERDGVEKFELLRKARIQRSFIHMFISRFIQKFSDYMETYSEFLLAKGQRRKDLRESLNGIAQLAGCANRQELYVILTLSTAYIRQFYAYRSSVCEKYLKQSSIDAKDYISTNGVTSDFHDVRQTILKAILVAIDKYDSDRGAFTSYLKCWIRNALTSKTVEHEYGIAYTVPQAQRQKIAQHATGYLNYSVSLDELSDDSETTKSLHSVIGDETDHSDDISRVQETMLIRRIAKLADIRGCARLHLDIGEVFSESELNKMREQTKREICK
jgi:hypothetical protein